MTRADYTPKDIEQAKQLACEISRSGLATGLKTDAQILVVMVLGAELGLSAMQSVRSIQIVQGKPTLSADLMVALAKRSTHCKFFRLIESTDRVATYETQRDGDPQPTELSFTWQDAERAQLVRSQTWQRYPKAMLRARCGSALARLVYPDLLAGIYDPEELAATAGRQDTREHPEKLRETQTQAPAAAAEGNKPEPGVESKPAGVEWYKSNVQVAMLAGLWRDAKAIGLDQTALLADADERFGCHLRELSKDQLQAMVDDYRAWRAEPKADKPGE